MTATEKFGLLYPGEYLLKGSDELINNRIKKFMGGNKRSSLRFAYNVKDEILAKDKRRKFRLFFPALSGKKTEPIFLCAYCI